MNKLKNPLAAAVLLTASLTHSFAITGFDDLEFWVGTGSNEAAMIIDFNDGSLQESRAWGYRWDGVASGAQMLLAIAAADPLLSITSSGTVADGFFVTSVTYGSQFAENGDFVSTFDFWGYNIAGGIAGDPPSNGFPLAGPVGDLPPEFASSPSGSGEAAFGTAGRFLADGSWDAWALNGASPYLPDGNLIAAPVPEPSFAALAGGLAALVAVAVLRRRGRN